LQRIANMHARLHAALHRGPGRPAHHEARQQRAGPTCRQGARMLPAQQSGSILLRHLALLS